MNSAQTRRWAVSLMFFFSGGTALIYEVVWSKYLSQMFGSTIQAQTVVLAVFMGGLALGNSLLGARADKLARPLRAYGFVEGAIGLYAFFFPTLYLVADRCFIAVGSHLFEHSALLLALKALLSIALLLLPTVLMGSTLPLMAAWLQKFFSEAGRHSARFYSINSLGAVAGAALAGFYLVETWGMVAALQLTALANLLIGAGAILSSPPLSQEKAPDQTSVKSLEPTSLLKWGGLMVAVSGGVSMGLEVLASRSISLIFGSSLQSFAIVLVAFIIGIGLGSGIVASERARRWPGEKSLIFLLVAATTWIALLVWRIDLWVDVYRLLQAGLARSSVGYVYHELLAAVLSMIVLGLPAALIGSVLPLMIRVVSETDSRLGAQVGRLLTWNTLGGVVGVLITGFVLMPHLGLRSSFLLLALVLCALAASIAGRHRIRKGLGACGATAGLVALCFAVGGEGWRHVMSSGVFRARETEVDTAVMRHRKEHIKILFYEDAPDATVTVEKGDGIGAPADLGLRINGKADASTRGDLCTQFLIGHLPLLARPDSQEVFLLGLGSGITGAAVAGHPIKRLTIAENCEPVIRAAQFFEPWNRGVLTNPITTIRREDARTVLKLSPRKYDVIITQPSNPWMAGVGSVFSREYYELAASRLADDGIMAQWFHVYDMHDGIVALVLRTFSSVFPYLEIWDSGAGDVVMLGSRRPWACSVETCSRFFAREWPRRDMERIGITSPNALLARQLASQRTAFAIAGDGPIQSDLFPVLEYQAPRAFYIGGVSRMFSDFDERTQQVDLCPPSKRQVLATLDDTTLRALFGEYTSVNPELARQLQLRFQGATSLHAETLPGGAVCRSVFDSGQPLPSAPLPNKASEEVRRVARAASLIESNPNERKRAVHEMEELLRNYNENSDWSVSYFGSLAAKASLADGDLASAKRIVALSRQQAPGAAGLLYLTRIIEREEALNVTNLASPRAAAAPSEPAGSASPGL